MDTRDGARADWDDIKTFVAAAQTGSFGAAARRLRTTQPTVTRRIDDLETRLGTRLFDRGLRGVTLTRAGEQVYDRALTMQRASVEIERLALDSERPEAGEVTIAAPEGIGGFIIAPEIAEFMKENPGIRMGLDCGFYPENPVDPHVDLSIQLTDATTAPEMTAIPLATLHYALFASREYLDTYGAPTRLEAAAGHRFVYHSAQVRERGVWGAKTSAFIELAGPALVLNSSTAMLHAIQRGAGVGAIPTAISALEPDLVMLDIPPLASATLWLCHHREALKSARVKRVSEWLVSIFDARERPWFRPEFVHPSEFAGWSWPAATAAVRG
ncbi:LysR family transcriptional regulator [Phenylobacterium sp.]|uniref:LysR family transcriptional regulator n=1 Tax=Phenylobacterium sp. TaxID=1871053 RepID=UPI002732CF5A|nr:LysR family transcriptional regulator [Phenylobacterium sp.]MDP3853777.1 LysR family transcriptional regulator [Phenylobacterium sp.]